MSDQELAAAEQQLADSARILADGIAQALPGWVVAAVQSRLSDMDPETRESAEAAGLVAAADIGSQVAQMLAADIDEQRDNPLALLRRAVRYPTEVLTAVGAPPIERDDFAIERFPDDVYDLTPASFADIHPDLQTPGLEWGAAKAFLHRRRHG